MTVIELASGDINYRLTVHPRTVTYECALEITPKRRSERPGLPWIMPDAHLELYMNGLIRDTSAALRQAARRCDLSIPERWPGVTQVDHQLRTCRFEKHGLEYHCSRFFNPLATELPHFPSASTLFVAHP